MCSRRLSVRKAGYTRSISDEDRRVIDLLCDRHLANHGGNPQQSLASFSFGGTVSYR
ncbi:MAG TPA: hypothetical protein VND64_14080 [Pirellulales bacterium]|nr:hypothetical protein [Pirellulales bacterium]